jgi:hypothetical protein
MHWNIKAMVHLYLCINTAQLSSFSSLLSWRQAILPSSLFLNITVSDCPKVTRRLIHEPDFRNLYYYKDGALTLTALKGRRPWHRESGARHAALSSVCLVDKTTAWILDV